MSSPTLSCAAVSNDASSPVPPVQPRELPSIIKRYRTRLRAAVDEDSYLTGVGRQFASHKFLANCTQGVYIRQVQFLSGVLTDYQNLEPCKIRILDWGCGKGHITYLLRKQGFDVTSCDLEGPTSDSTFGQDTPIIERLRLPIIPLKQDCGLPFANASFHCVLSFGVLEHVASDEASMLEIRRILCTGGIFYVTFLPYFFSWTQAIAHLRGDHYHDRLYTKTGFARLVNKTGFRVCCTNFGQLFPKNSIPLAGDRVFEPIDRFLCDHTPLRYLSTNLESVLVAA